MVRITNAGGPGKRLRALSGPEMAQRISTVLFAAGQEVQTEAQISITTGAVSGKGHVASLPGQPPNNDSGALANNIEAVQVEPLKVEVSSNAPYAAALEYGTSKMAARPYMAPATEKARQTLPKEVAEAVSSIVRRGAR